MAYKIVDETLNEYLLITEIFHLYVVIELFRFRLKKKISVIYFTLGYILSYRNKKQEPPIFPVSSCIIMVSLLPAGQGQETMQSSGHRFRDVEHHPLLAENDSYDSSSSEADMAERVWFIRDGCGMVCAIMTWLLVVYADFVVTFVMLLPSKDFWYSVINGVLFNCLAVLALSSHLRTMLTDPVSMQSFLDVGLFSRVAYHLQRNLEKLYQSSPVRKSSVKFKTLKVKGRYLYFPVVLLMKP